MIRANTALKESPWALNDAGHPRRIGIELEMTGLGIDECARTVATFLKTDIRSTGRYERLLTGDPAGDWIVEYDYALLKRLGREERETETLIGELEHTAEVALAWLAENLVPIELVSPPLPMTRLDEVESLIELLRAAGAKGTSDSLLNVFGMQLNPEIPSADPALLTAFLQAFLCLYDWLYLRADIDVTRRLSRYVDPFPIDYVRHVIAPAEAPTLATLIDDYLAANPTRNRALDLLPLFLHLDPDRVRAVTTDPLIKPRPTFHYRLPDCEVHLPDWGLYLAWNDWIEVERLAADPARLQDCRAAYLQYLNDPLARLRDDWGSLVEHRWLAP
ncbi:alpha-L-fucosidase [Thiocapsa imhoffii]|uniref:Alpha-L-fucosidase n=1 Tax=Thiocapsa imhoffii TaxID=382777 RepID=A0A9X1B8A1_9GAMM|nr:amidoligase family protein [Thiocapsa imhoffii]MBK1643746.1 alpha-L-fucosidase [Thiocapsa imhoffii]